MHASLTRYKKDKTEILTLTMVNIIPNHDERSYKNRLCDLGG